MNRSSSPIPPESGGGSGTLSNNALYAPLSTYVDDKNSSNNSRHSLSLQTTSSLRESSLITFLTTMSTNLKTTNRSSGECSIYRKLGGSISHHGMGDSDRAERSLRSMFESKLSNRSLVLVGGGIHSSMNYTTLNNRGYNLNNMAAAVTTTTTTSTLMQQTACGKRQRKRVGGNGIFGSISNKRRKRILKQKQASLQKIIELERTHDAQRTQKYESRGEQIDCVPGNHKSDATSGEDANQQQRNAQQQQQQQHTQQQHQLLLQQQTSSVIEAIHNKWSNHINQLLTMTMKNDNTNKDITTITTATVYERISHLLATSEHVGMAVTIVKCNSRRHLLNSRCIVINETKETWKMAMLVATKKKKNKKEKEGIKSNLDDGSGKEEKEHINQGMMLTPSWSIIMVPKRGTTLEMNVPWNESSLLSNKSAITSKETMNNIIVRLEN